MEKLMKLLCVTGAVLLVGFLLISPFAAIKKAHAAPTIINGEECAVFADMRLAARALFEEGLKREQVARIIAAMYLIGDERQAQLAMLVVENAKTATMHPREAALEFYKECTSKRGNVDEILGKSL